MARSSLQVIRWMLVSLCVIHAINANCPQGWKSWRDSCYILLASRLDWDQASRVCGRPRSNIAVPNSLEENDVIHQMQNESCPSNSGCGVWLGCRGNRGGTVTCLDQQQAPSFENFIDDQMTNDSDCVIMSYLHRGKWQDAESCSEEKLVICEMPRQVHVYSLTMASDGRIQPQCLHGHEIKKTTVKGVIECGAACWAEPRCRSFNLWQGGPHKICQLNNATVLESEEGVVIYNNECNYFEL